MKTRDIVGIIITGTILATAINGYAESIKNEKPMFSTIRTTVAAEEIARASADDSVLAQNETSNGPTGAHVYMIDIIGDITTRCPQIQRSISTS